MANYTLLLISSGQEWQFHFATDTYRSRMEISHCYWHLQIKNGNFNIATYTSSGQEWQFHISTDMLSGQEWQFHISTDI